MFEVVPTYVVSFQPLTGVATREAYRVPEANLEDFLHVLLLNGIDDFHVKREGSEKLRRAGGALVGGSA